MSLHRKPVIALIALAILACAAVLRTVYIGGDPPHGLSVSRGEYTDEGLKYYQARNRALFGQWRMKTPGAMQGTLDPSPVPNVLAALVFRAFGVGRVQARLISIASGLVSCLMLILIGVNRKEPATGLLAGAFLAANFIFMSYDRLGLFESPMVALCLTAAYFYLRGGWARIALTPAFLTLAYYARLHAIAIIGTLALAAAVEVFSRLRWSRKSKAFLAAGAVAAAAGAATAVALLMPGHQIVTHIKGRLLSEGLAFGKPTAVASALDLAVRTFSDSVLSSWMPLTLMLALLGLSGALTRRSDESVPRPAFVFAWWLIAAFALVALLDYRPTRYYVLIIPAACYLAADWIAAVAEGSGVRQLSIGRAAVWGGIRTIAGVQIAAVTLAFVLARRYELPILFNVDSEALWRLQSFIETNFLGSAAASAAVTGQPSGEAIRRMWMHVVNLSILSGAVVAISVGWLVFRTRVLRSGLPGRLRLGVAALLAFAIVASQAAQDVSFFDLYNRRYQMADAEKGVREVIGDNPRACIGGNWAPTMCMGTPYFTFPLARGNGNAWDTFRRFPVTHLLVEMGSDHEAAFLWRTFPEHMKRARLLRVFEIDVYKVGLFEYSAPDGFVTPAWPYDWRQGL